MKKWKMLGIVISLLLLSGCSSVSESDKPLFEKQVQSYLERKYGEKFTVDNTQTKCNELANIDCGSAGWTTYAHPVSNPKISVIVEKDGDDFAKNNLVMRSPAYEDSYWRMQAESELNPLIKQYFHTKTHMLVSSMIDLEYDTDWQQGRLPNFKTQLGKPNKRNVNRDKNVCEIRLFFLNNKGQNPQFDKEQTFHNFVNTLAEDIMEFQKDLRKHGFQESELKFTRVKIFFNSKEIAENSRNGYRYDEVYRSIKADPTTASFYADKNLSIGLGDWQTGEDVYQQFQQQLKQGVKK